MNEAETVAFEKGLIEADWKCASGEREADLVILNTCSVRQTAENRVWGRLGHFKTLKRQRKGMVVGVMGCMGERLQKELLKGPLAVDVVIGTFGKEAFLRHLAEARPLEGRRIFDGEEYVFFKQHLAEEGVCATIPVMHGCNNFCSYCIVPHVRGREVSRDPQEVVEEVRLWKEREGVEVLLLGQSITSYRYSDPSREILFSELLERVAATSIPRIRFLSPNPKDFHRRIIEVMGDHDNVCNAIHLPVQSGSNKVLKGMKRGYTREDYMRLIEALRETIPQVAFTTDLLVGFPGETEEDFQETLSLVEQVGFHDAYTYYYNEREGTPAACLTEGPPLEERKTRLGRLIAHQREIRRRRIASLIGERREVFIDRVSKRSSSEVLGRDIYNDVIVVSGGPRRRGERIIVEIVSLRGEQTLVGREV